MAGTWCMRRLDAHHITSVVKLQAVASHPHRYVVDTGRNGILKTCWILCIRPGTDGLEGCVHPPVKEVCRKSLPCKRNKDGLRTKPWGTAQVMTDNLEQEPFSWMNWVGYWGSLLASREWNDWYCKRCPDASEDVMVQRVKSGWQGFFFSLRGGTYPPHIPMLRPASRAGPMHNFSVVWRIRLAWWL